MYNLVSIGDITIDLYFKGEELTSKGDRFELAAGGKYYTDFFYQCLGGSGANIAIHGALHGLQTAVVAKVGEHAFKNVIIQGLVKKTVSTEFLYFDRNHMSISVILLRKDGTRTVIKHSDPKKHIEINPPSIDRIQRSQIVFMGNLPDISIDERTSLLDKINTDANIVALNFGSKDCTKGIKYLRPLIDHADILFLNRYEFSELVSENPHKVNLKKNHWNRLKSKKLTLVVTDGAEGSYAHDQNTVFYQPPSKSAHIVDTTGAGDAFTSTFLIKYSESRDVQRAMESASIYAASILSKIGAN